MACWRFSDYRCKEVVNLRDGCRLGYVCDLELELPEGRICAIYLPGPWRFFGLLGHRGWYRVPWSRVQRVGGDMILVDVSPEECRIRRERRPWGGLNRE